MSEDKILSLENFADGFSFPTSITFDDDGVAYIAESGLPFGGAEPGGKIWVIEKSGEKRLLAENLNKPVNGLTFHAGYLYVSEGGNPGSIGKLSLDGKYEIVLDNLPGGGNYHTNMVVFGPDNKMYFSQGAMTNTGVIGLDAYKIGWLKKLPHGHDVPGYDVVLKGINFETDNPLSTIEGATAKTGAFVPFGSTTEPGQVIKAQLPATASVMRCNPDGSDLELVAWGLRNAYGLGFMPDGRLLAVDQGADDRGSRPVGNVPDMLFEVKKGGWYGWPDYIGNVPVTDKQFDPESGQKREFILDNRDRLPKPEKALINFPTHTAAVKFAIVPSGSKKWSGQLLVALFGDEVPMTAPSGPKVGRSIVRVNLDDQSIHTIIQGELLRPIDVQYNSKDNMYYIVDFGEFEMTLDGVEATPKSGKIWRFSL